MTRDAIEKAARRIDPMAFGDWGKVGPRGWEHATADGLAKYQAARKRSARRRAHKIVLAFLAAADQNATVSALRREIEEGK